MASDIRRRNSDMILNSVKSPKIDSKENVVLMKDDKLICYATFSSPDLPRNFVLPRSWKISKIAPISDEILKCSYFMLFPCQSSRDQYEWGRFVRYLHERNKAALVENGSYEFYILSPKDGPNSSHGLVAYQEKADIKRELHDAPVNRKLDCRPCESMSKNRVKPPYTAVENLSSSRCNFVRTDPNYLKTLGHTHSGWIFGAIAELVDNARDAKATTMEIFVEMMFMKEFGEEIPILAVVDDGHGMNHQDVVKMTSFGHKLPDGHDPDHIGRFGVGFKTGAMRLGRDALVLTQSANSRSIAFLSQSFNEGKDNLEVPIVSYHRIGHFMEIDTKANHEDIAKSNLESIKRFSPFNEYLIGEKAAKFGKNGTGTQIYLWNLDKWGSNYSLEWHDGEDGVSSFHQGDILVRSRRIRSRTGQMSQKVYLDYSLRSYLEVMFLDPRMKIYVQGSLVKSRPLAKSLTKTTIYTGNIMEENTTVVLGHSQLEWEQGNCGIFLYWHGRLVEAYKRVGGMLHSDMGRGIIGVIDVTDLMDDKDGNAMVLSNKQGFQDCEAYALLEQWLGDMFNDYWDKNFDELQLQKRNALYKPDHQWVQCDKCRKWRMLSPAFNVNNLPPTWFCYMDPFRGSCRVPEEQPEHGVVTVSTKRTRYSVQQASPSKGAMGALDTSDQDSTLTAGHGAAVDNQEEATVKRVRRVSKNCRRTVGGC